MLLLDAELSPRMCAIKGDYIKNAHPDGSCALHAHLPACYDKRCCPEGIHDARGHAGAPRLCQAWARGHQVVVE
jgi:hypothetical protein